MPDIEYPGVYIEELGFRAHSIEGVPTSTAGFIGEATSGPRGEAVRITSFGDFEREFGGLDARFDLGYAVLQFFDNGGATAWVAQADGERDAAAGLGALDGVDPAVNLLSLPGWTGEDTLRGAVESCDAGGAFLVADPPGADPGSAMDLAARLAEMGSRNAAVYFPRVSVADPVNGGRPRWCPPSGSVAGVIARTDVERGVFAPPTDATITGVLELEVQITEAEAGPLNEAGVNTIRSFPGRGVRVWGGRTVASSSSEWRYVSVRRLAVFIERSLDRGLQWAVFEPNDPSLWIQVQRTVAAFLSGVWRSGGLQGSTEQEAYFVRCDRGVMTQDDLDNGRLVALVGFAPVKPAEFLLLRITVLTGAGPV